MGVQGLNRAYTDEQIETALTTVAITANAKEASRTTGIPHRTILNWCNRHADKLKRIQEERAPQIEQAVIGKLRQGMLRGADATLLSIEKAIEQLEAGEVKDAAAFARNLATTQAIQADKMLLLDGRPTSISEHRTVDDELRELERLGFFDTTCEEDPTEAEATEATSAFSAERRETNAPELSRASHS